MERPRLTPAFQNMWSLGLLGDLFGRRFRRFPRGADMPADVFACRFPWTTRGARPSRGMELAIGFAAVNLFMACGFYVFDYLVLHALFPGIEVWDIPIAVFFGGFITTLVACGLLNRLRTSIQRLNVEIQERESIEAALRLERDKFINILESMDDGVYIVNQNYQIEYVNPVIQREFGPVGDRRCHDYFHGRTAPCPWCKNQEVFAGSRVRWTWYSPRNMRTYDLFDTPLRNPDGTVSKLEIFHDITELLDAKEALRRSEERYRMLFNEAGDALFVAGLQAQGGFTRYQDVNHSACSMLGYSREELLQLSPCDIVAPEFQDHIVTTIDTLLREKQSVFERVFLARDGRRVHVEVSTRLFEHQGKRLVLATARDISRRRQAEEALRRSEDMYRKLSQEFQVLLNAITDGLVLLSPEMEVLWANQGQLCCSSEKLCSTGGRRHCYESLENRSAPCGDCPVLRCFQSGRVESQVSTGDGRYLNLRAFPILDGGAVHNVILVISDITEKMTLQAEAMQAGHLAALGELAAGVAHEINNPVNGVINYAQILINKSVHGGLEHDIAGRIIKESDRIANIVSSLLSFTRPRKDEKRPVSVRAVLSEALNLTQAQMRSEGIRLAVKVPEDLPSVVVNFQQIQQVFLNILNNARDALNEKYPGMHVDKLLEISGEVSGGGEVAAVCIAFHDHGTGIPHELVARVTKPFFSTKPEGRGTGLGLSISERIVTDHGGRLGFRSVEGGYTRVTVELPVGT